MYSISGGRCSSFRITGKAHLPMAVAEERMGWEQQDVAKKTISMYAQSQAVTRQRLKPPTMPCGIFQAGMDSERKEMKQMASLQKEGKGW